MKWAKWPAAVAGGALGAAATAETAVRFDGPGAMLPLAVLLALCATVPLALILVRTAAPAGAGRDGRGASAGGEGRGASGRSGAKGLEPRVVIAVAVTAATGLTVPLLKVPLGAGLAATVLAWAALAGGRIRRVRAAAADRDASRRAVEDTLLELTARGERARIARELHDVVAHHISMISVQAETARLAVPGLPDEGTKHLRAIGDTARTALTEMRRLLGVLREDAGPEEAPPRRPQPGLQQLLDLIDETREATGSGARLIVSGDVAVLDPGVELVAYRIVQEALTNARRHAPGAAVDVHLDYAGDVLRLKVRDNGPGPAGPGGHGLLGMRERAATVGGELRAGPAGAGGFLVEAILPAERLAGTGR